MPAGEELMTWTLFYAWANAHRCAVGELRMAAGHDGSVQARCGNLDPGFRTLFARHLKADARLYRNRPCLAILHREHLGDAGEGDERLFRDRGGLRIDVCRDGEAAEAAGLEPAIEIRDKYFHLEAAAGAIDHRIDAG